MKSTAITYTIAGTVCLSLIFSCLSVFPGAGGLTVACGTALMAAIVAVSHKSMKWMPTQGIVALLVFGTLSLCGVIINVNYYTVAQGTFAAHPVLENFDAWRDWSWACTFAYGDPAPDTYVRCFSYVVAALLWLFGRSIAVPVIFCSLCYLGTVALSGAISWRLTRDRVVGTTALIMTGLMCYLFSQSTILIKDCPVTLCFALITYIMVKWTELDYRVRPVDFAFLLFAILLLGLLRVNALAMIVLAILVMSFAMGRRNRRLATGVILSCVVWYWIVNNVLLPRALSIVLVVQAEPSTMMILPNSYAAPLERLIGDYTTLPFYTKILFLPLTLAVQALLPFPWNFSRDMVFGPVHAVAHFSFPWYFAQALILYWLFTMIRKAQRPMQLVVITGVVFTVVTAYITSGRIARYCLPYLPLLMPAASSALVNCRRRRSLWVWLGVFTLILTVTLLICYNMQMNS